MARLAIKSEGFGDQVLELRLGVNRFGRHPKNDFRIEHPTISSAHCEFEVTGQGVFLRDVGSTNGTFVDDQAVKEATLEPGQTVRLGDVCFVVEETEIRVAIPEFQLPDERPKPPVVLSDGSLVCPKHPHAKATHQCTHCLQVMCDECVHRLKRRGGRMHKFCPICSHECQPLGGVKKKKKSLFGFLARTVKMSFTQRIFTKSKG